MERHQLIGKKIGSLKITDYLGSGFCGAAFKTDHDTVLKFTNYRREIQFVSELLKGNLALIEPYVCKFYGMMSIDNLYYSTVIHKELLLPVGTCMRSHPVFDWINSLPKQLFQMLEVCDHDCTRNIGVNSMGEFKTYDPIFINHNYHYVDDTLFNNLNPHKEDRGFVKPYLNETLSILPN